MHWRRIMNVAQGNEDRLDILLYSPHMQLENLRDLKDKNGFPDGVGGNILTLAVSLSEGENIFTITLKFVTGHKGSTNLCWESFTC